MSSDHLNPTLTESDVQSFVEQMEALSAQQDMSALVCEDVTKDVQNITMGAVRRAVTELRVNKHRQYHRIPMTYGRFEVLLDFESGEKRGKPECLRVTTNEMREVKDGIVSVKAHDYAIGVHTLSVAHRQSSQLVKWPPTDLLPGALPVIALSTRGSMCRFAGRGYCLEAAEPLYTMDFSELTRQLTTAQALSSLLSQLRRDVTMEQEYPY